MPYTNLIKNTLDILDLNITFNENSLKRNASKDESATYFLVHWIISLTPVLIVASKKTDRLFVGVLQRV